MNTDQIKDLLKSAETTTISKWELDNIIYWDRATNPKTLIAFFERVQLLSGTKEEKLSASDLIELKFLKELLDETDFDDAKSLLTYNEDEAKSRFLEDLARTCAIETLTLGKLNVETMNTACKLSPNDFIICAKRTQDLINAIHGLVIKGESLSKDVAGA